MTTGQHKARRSFFFLALSVTLSLFPPRAFCHYFPLRLCLSLVFLPSLSGQSLVVVVEQCILKLWRTALPSTRQLSRRRHQFFRFSPCGEGQTRVRQASFTCTTPLRHGGDFRDGVLGVSSALPSVAHGLQLMSTPPKKKACKHLGVAHTARNGGGAAVCRIRCNLRRPTLAREAKTQEDVFGTAASRMAPGHPTECKHRSRHE